MTKIISIITARSGSKRLPAKNIKKINGKELIYYTINASLKSKSIKETYVDTDSLSIKKIAERHGAQVPFLRDKKFSHSKADSIETIKFFLKKLYNTKKSDADYIVLLQPTSPLRTARHIDKAVNMFLRRNDYTSLVSVIRCPTMFFERNQLKKKGKKFNFDTKIKKTKSNDKFHANGAIYIFKKKHLISKKPYGNNILPFFMQIADSVDIDYAEDFNLAKKLMS
ncbi:MAG: acylneuraminate cytidylyltransferase family protein [Pelagibacteraceae bacterium]|nr:acylneuraminate cytidylyltransferase family protein [Pelagibacteraceae bacterium]MCI5078849.1 acylneuraminate cytidylyltransferase family protein [Pelagibacteraceae bacterium]